MDDGAAVVHSSNSFQNAHVQYNRSQFQIGICESPVGVFLRDHIVTDVVGKDHSPYCRLEGLSTAEPHTACPERARIAVSDEVVPVTDYLVHVRWMASGHLGEVDEISEGVPDVTADW
jgi:hypothetical protein